MIQAKRKKFLSILLTLAMLLSIMSALTLPAAAADIGPLIATVDEPLPLSVYTLSGNVNLDPNTNGGTYYMLSFTQPLDGGKTAQLYFTNPGDITWGAQDTDIDNTTVVCFLAPQTGAYTFTMTLEDVDMMEPTITSNITVEVTGGLNAAPVVSNLNGDSVTFTEDSSAVLLDSGADATVIDSDNTNFSGGNATVSIIANRVPAEDVLSIKNSGIGAGQIGVSGNNVTYGGTTIGTFTGGSGTNDLVITFNINATPEAAAALIKALTYSNTNNADPDTTTRTVRVTVSDGSGGTSANSDISVNVTSVNDAPTLSVTSLSPIFTEDGSAVAAFAGASVGTIESGQTLTGLVVTVSNLTDGTNEIMNVDGSNVALTNGTTGTTAANEMSYVVSISGSTATLTLSKFDGISPAAMQTLINGIKYNNTSNSPTSGNRAITLSSLRDSGGTQNGGVDSTTLGISSNVTVVDSNDAPTITAPVSITVIEDVAAALTGISFSDADAGNAMLTATLSVPSGTLAAISGDGVTVGGTSAAMTLTGAIADLNAYIAGSNVTYTTALNNETSVTLTVSISDNGHTGSGGLKTDSASITLSVSAVNDSPTDITLSASSVNENTALNTTVGNLSTADPDAGNTFTYALVSGGGDTDNASFNISGSSLRITNSADYETKNSYSVRIRTTDQGSLTYEKAFTITINNLNEAPTDIALSANALNENTAANTTVGSLSSTDPDAGNTFTYTLVAGTGSTDNAAFNISGSSLRITNIPNYETKNSYSVRIRTTDQGGLYYEKAFTISINNLNEAPTDIALSSNALNENAAANTTVGNLSSTDPDAGSTFTYTLVTGAGSTDNASFNISGSSLRITSSPNYETKSSYSVRVRSTDQGGLYYEKAFTITISDLNETPGDITLSASSVNENTAANTTVGALATTDPDSGNTFTYTLVAGTGSTDNDSFSISGNSLRIINSPDYETKNSYSVRIRTTDQGMLWYEEVFTITINDVNEVPADISLSASTIDENVSANTTVGAFSTTDTDTGNTFTYTMAAGAGDADNAAFNIDNSSLRITNSPDYEAKSSYSVRVRTTDQGGLYYEKVFTITINNVNDAPAITSGATASFAENGTGAAYTAAATDPEGNTVSWSISGTDAILFNIDSVTGQISFITTPNFEVPGDSDHDNIYQLTLAATDNGAGSLTATKDLAINVTDVNEAPVISTADTASVTEGGTAAFIAEASDPEGSAVTWSITGGADQAKFSIVAGTGVVTFTASTSFSSPTDTNADNNYILQITASDGSLTAVKTVTVTVTKRESSGGSSSAPAAPTTPTSSAVVEVNGERQDAGHISSQTTEGTTVTTIKVDDNKLNNILEQKSKNATVTLPVSMASDIVVGELNGQTVKNMEVKEATLEIKTETVTYTLPASQINIDAVSSQLGSQVELKDIMVSVKIAEPPADTVKIIEDTATKGGYQLVVEPVEFNISCTSGDKTISVSKFNGYVERTVAIPAGIDASRITTGIVLNPDGTFRHVPTQVVVIDGKYYAKINSLTNSTYSVVYNPVTFTDVVNHWAKDAVNDMGSRMVVTGIGNGRYEPQRSITRAEFAAIIVRALGLAPDTAESSFGDVRLSDWFNGYVGTATEYELITGYNSASYGPNDTITREQAMAIIARAMKLTGLTATLTSEEVNSILSAYTDSASLSAYSRDGAAACLKTGIITGKTTATISPKDSVTRAEIAMMVQRLLKQSGLI